MQDKEKKSISKLKTAAALAAATVTIVPRHVLGGPGQNAPSDTLNIGCVGIGGKGRTDVIGVSSENIIALCDVDEVRAAPETDWQGNPAKNAFEVAPKAKFYKDFRVMLDKEKDIDAITVSTPDHTHAVIAHTAMKMGKHVFVQKPLTKTIYEARMLRKTAKEMDLVTQMGNQGHASEGARLINEFIWDGAIGDVYEVHCWSDRPIWPQGIARPEETPAVPDTLAWDLWLGPAPYRSYHPAYAPFAWRGWLDFGVGALGDMACHIMDHPFWALGLGYPKTVQATSTRINNETFPIASTVKYEFPSRGDKPPVTLYWYDGGLTPPRPAELEDKRRLGGNGTLYYGTKGVMANLSHGSPPRLIPESKMRDYKRPPKTMKRSPGIYEEWIDAIKNGEKSTTDFSYSGMLTEAILMGVVAIQTQDKNTILDFDAETGLFTNCPEANDLMHYEYRTGWKL